MACFFDEEGYPIEMPYSLYHEYHNKTNKDFKIVDRTYDPDNYMCPTIYRRPLISFKPKDIMTGMTEMDFVEKKSFRVYDVEIEEIDGNILSGVKTKSIKDINLTSKIYKKALPLCHMGYDDFEQSIDGGCSVEIECYTLDSYMWEKGAWAIFSTNGLFLEDVNTCRILGNQKYVKILQKFKFVTDNSAAVPYVQLICIMPSVTYRSNKYQKGDVITLFVKETPNLPKPFIVAVQPRHEQTFVSLLPKQKMHVITNNSSLEFRLENNSALYYIGFNTIVDHRRDCFECVNPPESQELIFIKSNGMCRNITVPVILRTKRGLDTSRHGRFPLIPEPVHSCMVYVNGMDGIYFDSRKKKTIRIDKEMPAKVSYTSKEDDSFRTKIEFIKPITSFTIEKSAMDWIARLEHL